MAARPDIPDSNELIPEPRQQRSRETLERFIDAGWDILQTTPWENISIADIAARAGRSVGAFYQRFGSKEDFLSVLMTRWLERGYADTDRAMRERADGDLIDRFLSDAADRISRNRFLWRAALGRAVDDPSSWEPFRDLGAYRLRLLGDRLGAVRGRPLDDRERRQLGFAIQVFNSVINNSMLNNPGPMQLDDPDFFPTMRRLFREICAFELP